MFRAWSKIVVSSLVLLGMDAAASESSQRIDESFEASNSSLVLLQPAIPDNTAFISKTSLACTYTVRICFSLDTLIVTTVTVPDLEPLKYHPFFPRAPPSPAS